MSFPGHRPQAGRASDAGPPPAYPERVSHVPSLESLHALGARQQPAYHDPAARDAAVSRLRTMPPLVFAGECDELKAKLALKVAGVSKGAREAVEKAGGSIELVEKKDPAALAAAKKGKTRDAKLAAKAEKKKA